MKKYPIFNQYFNRTPKGWALVGLIWFGISGLVSIPGAVMLLPEIGIFTMLISVAWSLFLIFVFYRLYSSQISLKDARIGKHLKKYYGLEGDELVATLDSIESEMAKPLYSDAMNKKRYNALFITENWVVGTDGIMLMRANACKIADIVDVENIVMTRYRKGITYYYYTLRIKDKNDYTYDFWLRSPENAEMAYEFLMKHLGREV